MKETIKPSKSQLFSVQPLVRRSGVPIYSLVVVLWAVYVVLLLIGPNDPNYVFRLGLTLSNFIRLTFAVPVLLIWLFAARAVHGFSSYAKLLGDEPEARGFRILARGLAWLFIYFVTILLFGRLEPLFLHTDLAMTMIFLKNHLPVYILLISFALLYLGSTALVNQASVHVPKRRFAIVWFLYLVFAAAYTYVFLVYTSPQTQVNGVPLFSVSHSVLVFTLILPSLLAWILGIIASVNLSAYAFYVRGVIYKTALRSLVLGIYASTVSTILSELLILNSTYLQRLGAAPILILFYALLIAYGIGTILAARGARKLARIEGAL